MIDLTYDTINLENGYIEVGPLLFTSGSFTRSNGTIAARNYERLTKASRRRAELSLTDDDTIEHAYRQGTKDALEALRTELT